MYKSSIRGFTGSILSLIVLLILWELGVRVFGADLWIFPGPIAIFRSFGLSWFLLLDHSIQTVFEAVLGLIFASLLGVFIAIAMKWSSLIQRIVYPFLLLSQTIPYMVLTPLLIIWFGYGVTAKVMLITLVCFFPIVISLFDGFQSVDQNAIRLLKSMGASEMQLFKIALLPACVPYFFSGLRIAETYAILGAVISEWMGASRGLGILLTRASKSYQTDQVFAIVAVIVFLSLFLVFMTNRLERRIIPWYYTSSK